MKRVAIALMLAGLVFTPVFAGDINLGDFPLGKWVDTTYTAVWEFSAGNITIVSPDGKLYYDFDKAGVQDFKVGVGADGPFITFGCSAAGKTYKISKPLTKASLILEITRPGLPLYRVEMAPK